MKKIFVCKHKFNIDFVNLYFDFTNEKICKWYFYDTFSNDLYKNKFVLYHDGQALYFSSFDDEFRLYDETINFSNFYKTYECNSFIFYHFFFPEAGQIRALILFAEAEFKILHFEHKNFDLLLDVYLFEEPKDCIYVLRTTEKSKQIKNFIKNVFQNAFEPSPKTLFETIFDICQITPSLYSTKLNLTDIQPTDTFGKLAHSILGQLTSFVIVNKEGIVQDYDAEFLHDWRVSIRRILVFLKNSRKFLYNDVEDYINSFEHILKNTNNLRDIDVFLTAFDNNFNNLIETDLDNLQNSSINKLIEARKEEHSRIMNFLESEFYVTFLQNWIDWLEKIKNIDTPIQQVAQSAFLRIFKRISNLSPHISHDISDEKAHKLRIYIKHLRYNIDFFGYFFTSEKKNNKIIDKLKKYQDELGIISDLRFIKEHLNNIADENIKTTILLQIDNKMKMLKSRIPVLYIKIVKQFMNYYYDRN